MINKYIKLVCVAMVAGSMMAAQAQDRRTPPPTPPTNGGTAPTGAPNGTARPTMPPASKGPKPYKEVVTDKAKSQSGLFKVHFVDDKYLLEIADNMLGRDLLVVNRIGKGAAGVRNGFSGFAGDIISESVIRFEKGPEDKIFLNKISFRERATDSTNGMYRSVLNSSIQPILYAFKIEAFGKDSTSSVIDVTSLLNSDNDLLFFDAGDKRSFSLGGVQPDKSYIVSVKTFPNNLNIRTVKTYSRGGAAPSALGGAAASFRIWQQF
ncbi:DUF5117 domain-containing protein [Phnomibacter ginsenosidimutans]|uniref:DUF5117 domain-containing protein n=1 Tax=Phnomibacter ginsenosidimutans TaxID=2676868 RepID=A0A6I6G7A2_9BACT|nr:DUF5117 domain-containing protein [Phnomibacter ginsenosidimutans]QGW27363.1 DUF5117 domain-containing protein [Phnomibacter ginsenosidimutans]